MTPDLSTGIINLPTNIGTQTFPEEFDRGYIQSFNLTIQQDIGWGFTAQAAYVGSRAVRQTANVNINAGEVGQGNAGRALAKYGRIANINMLVPFNTATYDSLQTQLTRRLVADAHDRPLLHLLEGDQLRRQQRFRADLELGLAVGTQPRPERL